MDGVTYAMRSARPQDRTDGKGASLSRPKIRDEKLWDSKKPRFLMKMSPIYF
jgi:hypothetical protein